MEPDFRRRGTNAEETQALLYESLNLLLRGYPIIVSEVVTSSAIDELVRLVHPPEKPFATSGDWPKVEASLGLELPQDYKDFISIYGTGVIAGAILIANPFARDVPAREFWEDCVDIYRDIASYGTNVPYELYPTYPGLLSCGSYLDVNFIDWLTAPASVDWKIIYYSRSHGFFNLGAISLTQFLVQFLTGSAALPPLVATAEFPPSPIPFTPIDPT